MVSSTGKVNKYEYLKGEEILSSSQSQTLEKTKFTYFLFGKTILQSNGR